MSSKVSLYGRIESFEFSHVAFYEEFYLVTISVKRLSGVIDNIPVLVSEKLHMFTDDEIGYSIRVVGEYRSRNVHNEDKNRLLLYVFAESIEFVDYNEDINQIIISGFLCKEPVYRKTPKGRQVSDLLIASNRKYGKSDYIPCIAWGREAIYSTNMHIGDNIEIIGRLQSREYKKDNESHIAYEVSVSKIDLVDQGAYYENPKQVYNNN